jgi:hypothetical protein
MKTNKQPKDFKISFSKAMRGFFLGAALVLGVLIAAGCADNNSPATVETSTPIPATVSPSETPLPAATLTPTATEEVVEGISSVEEIKTRIDDYLSGKEDYSVTGPNKDYLFVGDYDKKMPFSKLGVTIPAADELLICVQAGVYLGSYVLGSEGQIVSVFGTQRSIDKKPIIEFFTNSFLNELDRLPRLPEPGYEFVSEKNPRWQVSVYKSTDSRGILKILSKMENKIMAWDYICDHTQKTIDLFISSIPNEDIGWKKFVEWGLGVSKNNEVLVSWLQGKSETVPDFIAFKGKEVDFSIFDGEKIPFLSNFILPTPFDIANYTVPTDFVK